VTTLETYIPVKNERTAVDVPFPNFIVTSAVSFKSPQSTHVIRAELRTAEGKIQKFTVECVLKTDFIRCPCYGNYKGFGVKKVEDIISFWMSFRNDRGYGDLKPVSCMHMDTDWKYQTGESIVCHCSEIASHLINTCYKDEFTLQKLEEI